MAQPDAENWRLAWVEMPHTVTSGMDYGIIESVLRVFVRRICSGRKSAVRDLSSEETRISHGMVRAQLA